MKCNVCGFDYFSHSMGGPGICPACDCGIPPSARMTPLGPAVFGADLVICAWGSNAAVDRTVHVMHLLPRPLWALAINKDRMPKHPLYIRRDTRPRAYP